MTSTAKLAQAALLTLLRGAGGTLTQDACTTGAGNDTTAATADDRDDDDDTDLGWLGLLGLAGLAGLVPKKDKPLVERNVGPR